MSTVLNKHRELIQRYINGDISTEEKNYVESLLDNDPELQSYLRISEKVWDMLGEYDPVEPNPNYISLFWDRVNEENSKSTILDKFRSINFRWAFVSSFVTVLLISVFLINIFMIDGGNEKKLVFNEQDEVMLRNLDKAITKKTAASLEVFGPWEE